MALKRSYLTVDGLSEAICCAADLFNGTRGEGRRAEVDCSLQNGQLTHFEVEHHLITFVGELQREGKYRLHEELS